MKSKPFLFFKGKKTKKISSKSEHKRFIQEKYAEGKKEQREAKSIRKKILKRINKPKNILSKDKVLGRIKGKSTHGPRGNKNE